MKRLHINKRLDQLRDYDENHPRELKKYLIFLGGYVLLDSVLSFIGEFIILIIALSLGIFYGIYKGVKYSKTDENGKPELVESDELDYTEEELIEEVRTFQYAKGIISSAIGGFFFMSYFFVLLGQFLIGSWTIAFPVLLDIKWDTNWLYVNPIYILRTFFNLVQFMIMFYVMRRIKRKIRYKIDGIMNNNMDFFDKEFFKSVI